MSRTLGEAACLQEIDALLAHFEKITALDLAGYELGFPGNLFSSHFNRARDADYHIPFTLVKPQGLEVTGRRSEN